MTRLHRILLGLSLILLLGGAAGALTRAGGAVGDSRNPAGWAKPSASATTRSTTPTPPATTPTTSPGNPGPSSAALESSLITPTDMGGYYRVVPSFAAGFVASSPCLARLAAPPPTGGPVPVPAPSGRALTGLLGPDEHSVPTIVEEVESFPGATARAGYDDVTSALSACPVLSFDFGGPTVAVRLAATAIPPVGDADRVWSGSFAEEGSAFSIQLGIVVHSDEVLALVWIDSSPPSDPVMGSFVSTLSVAIGKLA